MWRYYELDGSNAIAAQRFEELRHGGRRLIRKHPVFFQTVLQPIK
jgi:hypothetical protein